MFSILRTASHGVAKANFGTNKAKNVQEAIRAVTEAGFPCEEWKKPGSGIIAIYSQGKIHINSSNKYWKDPVSFAKKYSNQLSTDDPNGVLNHEIAHAIYDAPDNFMSPFDEQKVAKEEVSKYSAMNPKEFVSEVYAAMCSGKKFPDRVMNMYNRYTRKKR